jgi:hypothetical protein
MPDDESTYKKSLTSSPKQAPKSLQKNAKEPSNIPKSLENHQNSLLLAKN